MALFHLVANDASDVIPMAFRIFSWGAFLLEEFAKCVGMMSKLSKQTNIFSIWVIYDAPHPKKLKQKQNVDSRCISIWSKFLVNFIVISPNFRIFCEGNNVVDYVVVAWFLCRFLPRSFYKLYHGTMHFCFFFFPARVQPSISAYEGEFFFFAFYFPRMLVRVWCFLEELYTVQILSNRNVIHRNT